jgi:hypothetical protein
MIYTAKPLFTDATECMFRIKNFGQLPPWKQMKLESLVKKHFALCTMVEGEGMLVIQEKFGVPVHCGQYTRRLEMFMLQLRNVIDPSLTFSTELVYA